MKICRIVSAYSPYSFGGADIYAEKISREIVKRGHPTVVVTINPYRKDTYEEDEGSKIYRFHPLNFSNVHKIGKQSILRQGAWTLLDIHNYYSYYKIRNILKNEKPDVVHLHTPLDVTLSSFYAIKSLGLPLVYTLHDYLLLCRRVVLLKGNGKICNEENINPLCKIYRKFGQVATNNKIDIVIAPSKFVLSAYKQNGFFKNCNTMVLPHGIDLDGEGNLNKSRNEDPEEGIFNISYTGGLTKHKGVHILISAFKLIRNEHIRLNIVGGGVYEKELRRMAADDNRIIFRGKFANKDMRQFYRNADILVVPSIWYDVRPNVIPEAFRDGVPVIGADIGGIPELIIENQTGFLFKSGDSEDLKRILGMVINNPQVLKSMSKNCFEFVKQFEMEKYLNKLLDVYRQAIEINHRFNSCSRH
ncbi:MAG: glycosyltransferase family 4 protein [Candidatus Omnitrophica bacterium]|nr:glycosyltransferase family 4 protein [Candidatus Omnitrophota bacterium]